jgi:hypothetical protein
MYSQSRCAGLAEIRSTCSEIVPPRRCPDMPGAGLPGTRVVMETNQLTSRLPVASSWRWTNYPQVRQTIALQ